MHEGYRMRMVVRRMGKRVWDGENGGERGV